MCQFINFLKAYGEKLLPPLKTYLGHLDYIFNELNNDFMSGLFLKSFQNTINYYKEYLNCHVYNIIITDVLYKQNVTNEL